MILSKFIINEKQVVFCNIRRRLRAEIVVQPGCCVLPTQCIEREQVDDPQVQAIWECGHILAYIASHNNLTVFLFVFFFTAKQPHL